MDPSSALFSRTAPRSPSAKVFRRGGGVAENQHAANHNEPDKVIDIDPPLVDHPRPRLSVDRGSGVAIDKRFWGSLFPSPDMEIMHRIGPLSEILRWLSLITIAVRPVEAM